MRKLLVVAAGVVAALFLSSGPAWAHNTLVEAYPQKGASLTEAPAEVKLRFLAALPAKGTKLVVTDAAGANAIGAVKVDGKFLSAPFTGTTGGQFTVTYELTSSDGHPVRNSYTFTVAGGPSPSPSTVDQPANVVTPTPAAASPSTTAAAGEQKSDWVPWVLWPAALGLVIGGIIAWAQRKRAQR